MSNNCQKFPCFIGVPVVDSPDSFSKMGLIPARHAELLLSWDQQLRGVIKDPAASLDLVSLFSVFRQSGLRLSWVVTAFRSWCLQKGGEIFCLLLHVMNNWLFSSEMHLLLCESTSCFFLRLLWRLTVNFLFSITQLGSWGSTSPSVCWRFCDAHASCVPSSLLSSRMFESDCCSPGDVWMALSIILSELGLAECSDTRVLSSFRASSSMFRPLSCSSLRLSRLFFRLCKFEPCSAVASPPLRKK